MALTASERQQAHRVGRSSAVSKRFQAASVQNALDAGEFGFGRSALPTIAGAVTVADKAYWVYVGRAARACTATNVKFWMSTAGAGAQVAEVAIATGSAPNAAAQSLTVVAVASTLTDLTVANASKKNTTSFGYAVNATDHLWVGLRTNMADTQPTVYGHTFDCSNGEILSTTSAGILAVGTTYTGALITESVAWQAPALVLVVS